jgi:hypothetical protein
VDVIVDVVVDVDETVVVVVEEEVLVEVYDVIVEIDTAKALIRMEVKPLSLWVPVTVTV